MLVSSGNTYEIPRGYTLLTGGVLVQIGALHHDDPNIVGVGVHAGVVSRHEFSVGAVRSRIRVPPDGGHGDAGVRCSELRLIGGSKDDLPLTLLSLHPSDGPRDHERRCHSDNY